MMRNRIWLIAAGAAALSVTACNRPDGSGSQKEKNEAEETKNASGEEDGENRNESGSADRGESGDGGERNSGEAGGRSRRDYESGRSSGGGDEGELREALQEAAREQRARLPLRDGITTVYDVEAEGTEFIVSLRISEDFSDEQFDRLERAFQRNSCNGDSAELIRLGATTTYRVTDAEGERRSFSFDSC